MTLTNFYHAYCGGFEKQARTLQEIQVWLDGKRRYCAGKELNQKRYGSMKMASSAVHRIPNATDALELVGYNGKSCLKMTVRVRGADTTSNHDLAHNRRHDQRAGPDHAGHARNSNTQA